VERRGSVAQADVQEVRHRPVPAAIVNRLRDRRRTVAVSLAPTRPLVAVAPRPLLARRRFLARLDARGLFNDPLAPPPAPLATPPPAPAAPPPARPPRGSRTRAGARSAPPATPPPAPGTILIFLIIVCILELEILVFLNILLCVEIVFSV